MNASEIPVNANPLDTDFSQVEIKRQVLAGGLPYELLIKKCEIQKYGPNTKHPGDEFIHIEQANLGPASSPTGDSIAPGQVMIFHNINLKPYGKQTQARVNEDLARFQQALSATGPLRQTVMTAAGRTVRAKVKVSPAGVSPSGKSFPEKNEIDYYMKPGATN